MVFFSKKLVEHQRVNFRLLASDKRKHLDICRVIDCLNTIYDMQNEKDYINHYNEFLHNLDFVKLF